MSEMVTRAYNKIDVFSDGVSIKKSSSTERLKHEAMYYLKLQKEHPQYSGYFPRMFDCWIHGESDFWMELELYDYPNLGTFALNNAYMHNWEACLTELLNIIKNFSSIHPRICWSQKEQTDAIESMYLNKTINEYQNFKSGWGNKFEGLFDDELRINGIGYRNFDVIWPEVSDYIETNLFHYEPSLIHGDMCFSNILYGNNKNIIRFVDPRGSFGKVGIYGDIRYDVAKLYHSTDGVYETIINDLFSVKKYNRGEYIYVYTKNLGVNELFENIFFEKDFDKKQIKTIQGLIFVGMCARHYDNENRQQAMYLTGIKLLNEAMEL
jgi:hypothetical protein